MIVRLRPALLVLIAWLALLQPVVCGGSSGQDEWVTYVNAAGETVYVRNDRQPSLYTGNYGDCLSPSLINVTRFDAAYYKDNMTVVFHLGGNSQLTNESLVMYIGVYAYGSSRFELIFNPCHAGIDSLCPLNSSIPIVASGIIPVSPVQVSGVPSIAFAIPDFEGQAILRIFANSTQSEIACYSAVVTNGRSFAHPKSVGTILGLFTLTAVLASFATAIYGEAVPTMRLHYAHSLSVGVVFAVFQHIYFTGALSMNWPSVLVAWWHNFAWSGGMIYSSSMQSSINHLIGSDTGNTTAVGAAQSGSDNNNVGGGLSPSLIYRRMWDTGAQLAANHPFRRTLADEIYRDPFAAELRRREALFPSLGPDHLARSLQARGALPNATDGFKWYGHELGADMPLPGNYSGFAGTLAQENIAISNAFMTGFLWFLILLVILVVAVVAFKWTLELLVRFKRVKQTRFQFFRDRWVGYASVVALRTCYIGFFSLMFLTMFEFTFASSAGVKVVAAIVFFIFLLGISGAAVYACYYKKHFTDKGSKAQAEHKKLLGVIPWAPSKKNSDHEAADSNAAASKLKLTSFWKRSDKGDDSHVDSAALDNIHDNEDYTIKFGWLASRFRRTRWWFFTVWLFYEFVRAVFYAGASGHPLVQVFGILVIEFIAFVFIIWARPFEGRRLNVLVVYCLGFSKVATVALSAAFDIHFNLPRITTTVVGIVVIVIQGILTIITMIAIVVGAISSYMSISRNREDFRPRKWHGLREKYFDHLDRAVSDMPEQPAEKEERKQEKKRRREAEKPVEPEELKVGFEVKGIKRLAKIDDEDAEFAEATQFQDPSASCISIHERPASIASASQLAFGEERSMTGTPTGRSRTASLRSVSQTNLPYGARQFRASWAADDFVAPSPPRAESASRRDTSTEADQPDTESVVSTSHRRRKTSSFRSKRKSSLPRELTASSDELHLGGDVSTWDTIGDVPVPTTRPRASSTRSARSNSGYFSGEDSDDNNDILLAYPRSSKYTATMTPAQERDEWLGPTSPPVASRP